MDITKYSTIIFDFDGVIVDSNDIKKDAIRQAASRFSDAEYTATFVDYFISNNGIPREIKINKYFPDEQTAKAVLADYNQTLDSKIATMALTDGFSSFIERLSRGSHPDCYILSGGSLSEVKRIVEYHGIGPMFSGIFGGPQTKTENIQKIPYSSKSLFIGDSIVDYQVAKENSLDFAFMYGYTQFSDWQTFFRAKSVTEFKNFNYL